MIEQRNLDRLSIDDKLFMIYNTNCFTLPSVITINFHKEKWMEEINVYKTGNDIIDYVNKRDSIMSLNTINKLCTSDISSVENELSNILKKIVNLPCESIFDIKNIICMSSIIEYIYYNNQIKDYYKEMKKITDYIFNELLPWKLQAHEIIINLDRNCIPTDDDLRNVYLHTFRYVLKEIMEEESSYEKMALLIYQLLSYIDEKSDESTVLDIICKVVCNIHHYNFKQLSDMVKSLLRESVDSLYVINNLPKVDDSNISNILLNKGKRTLEENYEKNKISTRIKNGGLCVGDDVFDNGIISTTNLLVELDMISEDKLKDYIGEIKSTTFSVPENDIGYLKLKENLPICKVMTRDNFYTLTRYNNKSFLLFKILGDDKCYGISFPSDFGGGRQVVMFDIPTEFKYEMTLK